MKKQTLFALITLTLFGTPVALQAESFAPATDSIHAELAATSKWVVANVCGNGVVEEGEVCDGGNNCAGDCKGGVFHGEAPSNPGGFQSVHAFEAVTPQLQPQGSNPGDANGPHELTPVDKPEFGPLPGPAKCGNGAVEEGESCDDGNTMSGDGCKGSCQADTPSNPGPLADRTDDDSAQVASPALPMLQGGCTLQAWTTNAGTGSLQALVGLAALLLPLGGAIAKRRL